MRCLGWAPSVTSGPHRTRLDVTRRLEAPCQAEVSAAFIPQWNERRHVAMVGAECFAHLKGQENKRSASHPTRRDAKAGGALPSRGVGGIHSTVEWNGLRIGTSA